MAIAFFSTWTTYGTWLPGDARGWFSRGGLKQRDLVVKFEAAMRLSGDAVTLNPAQREIVENTIADHCLHRGWILHAVHCRTNHVHVVVSAPGREIDIPREQFKAWCTRKLGEQREQTGLSPRADWWTQRGWDEFVDDQEGLEMAVSYVRDCQDRPPQRSRN